MTADDDRAEPTPIADWSVETVAMELDTPFGISRGTTTTAESVVVRLTDEHGTEGVGAGCPDAYYGETVGTVESIVPDLLTAVDGELPSAHQRRHAAFEHVVRENPAAKAAVDVACYDLHARQLGEPLHALLGTDPERAPGTCFSVGLAEPDEMRDRAAAAVEAGFEHLKVKLGTERDRERVAAVREGAPDVGLRVDANEAWTPAEAVRKSHWLADHGVAFVEQPVPASDREGLRFVYEHSSLPVGVDESCVTASDVPDVADRADVAVVKLDKSGGVWPSLQQIHAARAHDLEVMVGCMVETNASLAAGAALAPLCDYADLDGSLLLADGADPFAFDGIRADGTIALDEVGTGIGVKADG
ncbi:dipeptide epimerase [Haloglomus salinum]|jgi:L-alanine-DL-glutamate epimerase-like enolase superfamily enzyme|uniref:dipeptide epimerase n=1 Tax=Haloglomus salinum TaxID=2962673 RepID=UPI0020C9FD5E|nr:dipeptide epimerase [Haloglomus salinum]